MEKEEIWVIGKNGQLATCLKQEASRFPHLALKFLSSQEVNFESELSSQLNSILSTPSLIINCAAYTAVDLAEQEKAKALRINGAAVEELVAWVKEKQIPLIHFSTDYVFNGEASEAYTESEPTSPINTYGESKLIGEQAVLSYAKGMVFRISWLYSSEGKNFLLTIKNKLEQGQPLQVVNDQTGCPTSAHALAFDILTIVQEKKCTEQTFGLYHYSHDGQATWFEFAKIIREHMHSKTEVNPTATSQFPTPAKRPTFSKLNPAKSLSIFGLPSRFWKDEVIYELNRITS